MLPEKSVHTWICRLGESDGYAPGPGNTASAGRAEDKKAALRRAYVQRRMQGLPVSLMDAQGMVWPLMEAAFGSSKKLKGEKKLPPLSKVKRKVAQRRFKALRRAKELLEA